jgi:hypothetical protein
LDACAACSKVITMVFDPAACRRLLMREGAEMDRNGRLLTPQIKTPPEGVMPFSED